MEIDNGMVKKNSNKLIIIIIGLLVIFTILITLVLVTSIDHTDFGRTSVNNKNFVTRPIDNVGITLRIIIMSIVWPLNFVVICLYKWNDAG